jgi:hypothetical protein
MCVVCAHVKSYIMLQGFLDEKQTENALKWIASEMKKGKDVAHLETLLDKILGTGLSERDLEAEEAWEKAHRKDG